MFRSWRRGKAKNTSGAESEQTFEQWRREMVRTQIEARGVCDQAVLAAMRKVHRHLFVPENLVTEAYEDCPLPIGYEQTISQPYIVALMTELLVVKPDETVLEVGAGSGYQAAVLAEMGCRVISLEIVHPLAERAEATLRKLGYTNVQVVHADGYDGFLAGAPFDGIIATAAPDHIPKALVDQLKEGRRLVLPIGVIDQNLWVIEKSSHGLNKRSVIPVRFVPMTGQATAGLSW